MFVAHTVSDLISTYSLSKCTLILSKYCIKLYLLSSV